MILFNFLCQAQLIIRNSTSHLRCGIFICYYGIMPYRETPFEIDYFYHVFSRGVEKRVIFTETRDYERFLQTLYYYQFKGPKPKFSHYSRFKTKDFDTNPKIVEINCYCLMPNHFHLLIKQLQEGGVKEFMQKLINSYTKYFNTKHQRVGHLFQGMFKAVLVETDEQLVHLSRYIHLNPYADRLIGSSDYYPYSSYLNYVSFSPNKLINTNPILNLFKNNEDYKQFVDDQVGYALELERIKHTLIDIE